MSTLVVKTQGQGLQVLVDAHAQVGQYAFTACSDQPGVAKPQECLAGKQQEQGQQNPPHHRLGTREQAACNMAAQPWDQERCPGFGQHQQAGQGQLATVRCGQAYEKTELNFAYPL